LERYLKKEVSSARMVVVVVVVVVDGGMKYTSPTDQSTQRPF
jgi:hypothetical protein